MLNPFTEIINQVLVEPQAGLLNGILFGTKASLTKDFYQALITTGTVHIVALSGQNITILARLLSEGSLVLGRKTSLVITGVGICLFIAFVGVQSSVIRAAVMAVLSLLSVYFGRQYYALLALFLAALVMLIINPAWVFETSFQLSFLATLGIVLLVKSSSKKPKNLAAEIKKDVILNLKTTLAAQLFTLPVMFFNFRTISLIAPLTNILIAPVVTPIMILGFILSLVGVVSVTLAYLVGIVAWVPLSYLILIVKITAAIPYAAIKF
jgi:competence protein ComEC